MSDNPLLAPSALPHGVPAFDRIKSDHFLPAIESAIEQARSTVEGIKANKAAPDFDNTIVALETASDLLGTVTSIFYNLLSAAGNDTMESLAEQIGPIASRFSSDITLDPVLFARVKAVYDARQTLSLTPEQTMLLDNTFKGFIRNGAQLQGADRDRSRAIDERLSVLSPTFQKNLKKSTEAFELRLSNEADLDGLPETARQAAAQAATEKGYGGEWLFTLHAPSFSPFISYATRRDLREKIWRAFSSRAYGDSFDNSDTVREIVALKTERARLLGFKDHADYTLSERMAKDTQTVRAFLDDLIAAYRPAAHRELDELRAFGKTLGIDDLKPWDVAFVREKLQEQKFHFSSEDLRPYFPLSTVLDGTFTHFSKLFGVTFTRNTDYPVWHSDVVAYDVIDNETHAFMGVFYADFFPRTGKQSGAWMTTFRDQGLRFGKIERPLVAIVCNFTKPTGETPSLLTHDEVTTLFHEMGHAMHMMLSDVTYASLSGTNVKWDFVELPSQVQENWAYEPETLALISRHHKTGDTIPAELVGKLRAARTFLSGIGGLRQMAFSLLDLTWYITDPATIPDIAAFEDRILKDVTLFPRLAGPISTSFGHIFGGGYSAGYYSYKWAEVLDADAFDLFLEQGLYNQATAQTYRRQLLAKGGAEDPNILYARFRGRKASPDALLRREGLST